MVGVTSVVIAGGGYAGTQVALGIASMAPAGFQISLIDRRPGHQLIVRLPEVVSGRVALERAQIPYARLFGNAVHVIRDEIVALEPNGGRVVTASSSSDADFLVVALGSSPAFHGMPGAEEFALPLRSVEQAEALHQRLQQVIAEGRLTRVVIAGAGYTGTEVAGELAEWGARLRSLGRPGMTVRIVAPEPRLVLEADPRVSAKAEQILQRKGVQIQLGANIQSITADSVELESGPAYEADVVIWAARAQTARPRLPGVKPIWPEERVPVDPYLRSQQYENVFVAGDVACAIDFVHDRVVPASAQMAVQEGRLVAQNIVALGQERGLREFRPRRLGEAISLGGTDAVAEAGGVVFGGRRALALKRAALLRYLYSLGGVSLVRDFG